MNRQRRPPFWRDIRVLRVVAQIVAVVVVGAMLYVLWFNLSNNLRRLGIRTDFEFLDQPFGVRIAGSDLSPGSSVREALLNGVRNTLALAVVGLPLLTVIGVLIGVGRLSSNWLVARVFGALRRDGSQPPTAVADRLRVSGGGSPPSSCP